MHYLLLSLLLIFPSLASAQDLHRFSNGEVADAEKINQNFQYVLENATGSGGCSAEQDGSSIVITCADGTSGVLAGQGQIVFVSGLMGEIPDVTTLPSGLFYLIDNEDRTLGIYRMSKTDLSQYEAILFDMYVEGGGPVRGTMVFTGDSSVKITGGEYSTNWTILYASEDCSGQGFYQQYPGTLLEVRNNEFVIPRGPQAIFAAKSTITSGHFSNGQYRPPSQCQATDSIFDGTAVVPFTPAAEVLNPSFPLRIEQRAE